MKRKLLFLFVSVLVLVTSANAEKKSIAFLEDPVNISTLQEGVKETLRAEGYILTSVTSSDPIDFAALDTFGLVIISRALYSSSINDPDAWAAVKAPVLILSPYVLGYDALNLIGGVDWSATGLSDEGTTSTITQGTPLVTDNVFNGITSDGADFDFYTYFYNIPPYKVEDFTSNQNSGTPMVAVKTGSVLGGDGAVIMARWPAGVETYPESATTPVAVRSYIGIGADIWQGAMNLDNYTPQSKQLLLNEVSYLMSLSNSGGGSSTTQKKSIAFLEDPVNISTLQEGVKETLRAEGYVLTSVTSSDPIDFAALDTFGLVIISRALYSSSINDPDAWAAVKAPVLILSPYVLGYDALNLIGGVDWSATGLSDEGTTSTITQGTPLVTDNVFNGITSDGADFDFYTYFYNIPPYKVEDFTSNQNSGTPMVAVKTGSVLGGDGAVIMARWPAGVETYPESATTPVAVRSYIGIGADIWQGAMNLDNYTPQSKQLLLNEVSYLINGSATAIHNFILEDTTFSVFPNPSKDGRFTFKLGKNTQNHSLLQVYSIAGQLVYSENLGFNENVTVNTDLRRGMYLATIIQDGKRMSKKIIVQ